MSRLDEWRETRRLTTQRAGTASQRFASERLDRYVRSRLTTISAALLFIGLVSAGIWMSLGSRPGFQGLAVGFVAGIGVTFLYHWCVIASGATSGTIGQAAEQWTDSELRRLRRKGWKYVNHMVVKPELGDIDHVAVGPDGVIVVETKWRSHEEDVDDLSDWMSGAIRQATRNRKQIVQLLNWQHGDPLLVRSLVVLWGPEVTHESAQAVLVDDVNVISGKRLRDELAALNDERLSAAEIDVVYDTLKARIARRDAWERANLPAPPLTMQKRANRWARNASAAWVGLLLTLLTFTLGWWAFPAIGALAGASLGARQVERLRTEATAFLCGVMATIPLLLVAALWP